MNIVKQVLLSFLYIVPRTGTFMVIYNPVSKWKMETVTGR